MLDWQAFLTAETFWQAWQKVRSRQGCAGVDGETIATFERHADRHLATLRRQLHQGTYQPLPLRTFKLPKPPKLKPGEPPQLEWRQLAVPTVRDRIVQQALLNLLYPILEPHFEASSFAYRPGRSHHSAVRQVDQWRKRGYDWVLDADIIKYFDHVQHDRLFAELQERVQDPAVGKLVEQWVSSGVATASGLILPTQGIPPGSVVSPILATFLEGHGRRVQKSVFECFISLPEMKALHRQVQQRVKLAEDNVRFYWVPADALPRTLTIGSDPPQPPPAVYIV